MRSRPASDPRPPVVPAGRWGLDSDRLPVHATSIRSHEDRPRPMARPTDPAAAAHDRVLVSRMGDGEERALGELYDRHGGVAYAVAYRVLGLRAGAEEVVMEVLAQAWREASRFDPARGSVASWLVTMARSRALDAARSSPRRTRPTPVAAPADAAASARAAASDGEVAASERSLVVREAVAQLTPAQREAIELAFYGGLTQSEIAERLQAPPGTVKARLRLGMQKLREALAPWLEERTT